MQQFGIAGSSAMEGVINTQGVSHGIMDGKSDPVIKRATIIWLLALGALMVFHVGGSRL